MSPRSIHITPNRAFQVSFAAVLLVITGLLLLAFFERIPVESLPLATDWKGLWRDLSGGQVTYRGLLIPPWILPVVIPLGLLSLRSSWGLLTLFTLAVLVVSVPRFPRTWQRVLVSLLLITSWPTMRHIADGNFEGLVIAGILLCVHGYRTKNPWVLGIGLLLATTKPQETWAFVLTLGLFVLATRPVRDRARLGLGLALVIVPAMLWMGQPWLDATRNMWPPPGSLVDMSLIATMGRLGASSWLTGILWIGLFGATVYLVLSRRWSMRREKAALLVITSLLLAPYAAGNSFLTVLAVGIVALLYSWRIAGAVLLVLTNLFYVFPAEFSFAWGATYWTVLLIVSWAVLCYHNLARDNAEKSSIYN